MPKWLKFIIAVLLLPVCIGSATALGHAVRAGGEAVTTWVPMAAGAACWFTIFVLMPKPMWVYVFGHELTHAVWTWLFGGRVKKFKVTSSSGHVIVTKTNFLIALAPYFFPLYAVLVTIVFLIGQAIWKWQDYQVWFHLLIGAAYSFHLTLTFHVLQTRQSDITEQGYLFSAAVIWLGNVLVLILGLSLLTPKVDLRQAAVWWFDGTRDSVLWVQSQFQQNLQRGSEK